MRDPLWIRLIVLLDGIFVVADRFKATYASFGVATVHDSKFLRERSLTNYSLHPRGLSWMQFTRFSIVNHQAFINGSSVVRICCDLA
jgi:hypothetical protein